MMDGIKGYIWMSEKTEKCVLKCAGRIWRERERQEKIRKFNEAARDAE